MCDSRTNPNYIILFIYFSFQVFDNACAGLHSDVIYQNCTDVNECDYDHGECDPHAFCTNTIVSTQINYFIVTLRINQSINQIKQVMFAGCIAEGVQ